MRVTFRMRTVRIIPSPFQMERYKIYKRTNLVKVTFQMCATFNSFQNFGFRYIFELPFFFGSSAFQQEIFVSLQNTNTEVYIILSHYSTNIKKDTSTR